MNAVKVNAVDMSGRLNTEGNYSMKVSGYDGYDNIHKDYILDLSDLDIDQIGVIAGFLDAVFDECGLLRVTGASIVKTEEVNERIWR